MHMPLVDLKKFVTKTPWSGAQEYHGAERRKSVSATNDSFVFFSEQS